MNYDRESLILEHLELAKSVAISEWRTATHALQKDELIALANLGLTDAANRWESYCKKNNYDPAATQYFQVFARLRIRGTIRDQLRKDDWATRTLRSKSKKLKDAGQDEGVPIDELSIRTDMSVTEIRKVNARLASRPISLDAYTSGNDKYSENSFVSSGTDLKDAADTESSAFSQHMISIFIETMKKLPPEVKVVLVLHYYKKIDLKKVSEELGLAESRISQLHATGITTIKNALVYASQERD